MTTNDILRVLEKEPRLTSYGIESRGHWDKTYPEEFEREQAELIAASKQCTWLCEWLADVEKAPAIHDALGSVGLKLLIDDFSPTGECFHGAVICAAIHMGFDYEREAWGALLNTSIDSLNRKAKLVNHDFGDHEFQIVPAEWWSYR